MHSDEPRPTRRAFAVIAILMMLAAGLGPALRAAPPPSDRLAAMLQFEPGMTIPASVGGVALAIWEDGLVIFSFGAREDDFRNLQMGHVPPARVAEMLDEVERSGLPNLARSIIVPDGAFWTISIRSGDKLTVSSWNQALTVPWGAHIDAPRDERDFAKAWMCTRAILAFTQPSEYKPLEPGSAEDQRLEAALKHLGSTPIR